MSRDAIIKKNHSQGEFKKPREVRLIKLSKQNLDNVSSVIDSRVRIKTQALADLANQFSIHKHFLGQYQKL